MSKTQRSGAFLVYFNGIETPVSTVSVSFGVWAPPTADISMPADPLLRRLGHDDRVRVTVFFLDDSRDSPEYCLLFDGEIHGTSTSSSKGSKMRTFHCVDMLSALSTVRSFFLLDIPGLVSKALGDVNTQAPVGAHFRPIFPVSLFFYGLDPAAGNIIRRPYDFLENMFRALISVRDIPSEVKEGVSGDPNSHKGAVALDWFSRWCRRTGFHRRFLPMPGFEEDFAGDSVDGDGKPTIFPVLKAMQSDSVIEALTAIGQRVGDSGTMWSLLMQVFQQMLYEVQAIPAPPCVGVRRGTYAITGSPGTGDEDRIVSYVTKPQLLFGLAPACNVIWASQRITAQSSESYNQPTRVLFSEGSMFGAINPNQQDEGLAELINTSMAVAFPPQAQEALNQRLGRAGSAKDTSRNPHNFLVWPNEFYIGPTPVQGRIPTWFRYLNMAEATQTGRQPTDTENALAGSRREMALFLDPLITRAETDAGQLGQLRSAGLELDGARRALLALRAPTSGRSEGEVLTETRALLGVLRRLGYAAAAPLAVSSAVGSIDQNPTFMAYAAYEYWRERLAKRNGSAALVFQPFITPGFPAVIWDTEVDAEHQIGYITNVQHSLSESSMSTSVSWTFGQGFNEFFEELRATRTSESGRPSFADDLAVDSVVLPDGNLGRIDEEELRGFSADQVADYMRRIHDATGLLDEAAADGPMDAAPPSPIQAIRRSFQRKGVARTAYGRLFWRGQARRPFPESILDELLDLEECLEVVDTESGQARPLDVDTEREFANPALTFRPIDAWKAPQSDPEAAANYCWRPATTLDEFIKMHSDIAVSDLAAERITPGDPLEGKGHTYYRRIFRLRAGPGSEPAETSRGGRDGDTGADTRYNWERVLLTYRARVYQRRGSRG